MQKRPETVPAEAVWSPSDNEWILAPADGEGRHHGVVTFWRPDGTLVNHCSFEHGVPHGWYKRYHESGEVSREGHFVNGKIHGTDVFYRSEHTTSENFPSGTGGLVWRIEMDMRHGELVAGRCFDSTGRPVSDSGEPLPDRPEKVPGDASFDPRTRRWLTGATDGDYRRHGIWSFYDDKGVLVQECGYDHGTPRWYNNYSHPEEAEAETALREGRWSDAETAARSLAGHGETADRILAAALLGRALVARSPETPELEPLVESVLKDVEREEFQTGVFMESVIKVRRAAGTLLGLRAGQIAMINPSLALELVERAIELDHSTGGAAMRALQFSLLRRLGRDDEAFHVARRVLAAEPDAEGFDELRADPGYASWLESIRTDAMTLETALDVLGAHTGRLAELAAVITGGGEGEPAFTPDDHEQDASPEEGGEGPDLAWPVIEVLGDRLSVELQQWIRLHGDGRLKARDRGLYAPALDSTLSGAVAARDGVWVARLQSLFLPAGIVSCSDEELWIAHWHGGQYGNSEVYYQHQDEPEWFMVSGSISGILCNRIIEHFDDIVIPEHRAERWKRASELILHDAVSHENPGHLEVDALEGRTHWIVKLLLGLDIGRDLESAPEMDVWESEKTYLADWPHLQAYWLFHHIVFDNRTALEIVLASCERRYPAVAELAEAAEAMRAGEIPSAGFWDSEAFAGLRVRALEEQRIGLFESETVERLEAATAPLREAQRKILMAKEALRLIRRDDTETALSLWEMLEKAAGNLDAFEAEGVRQLFPDEDRQIAVLMGLRRGHASVLPHLFSRLGFSIEDCPARESHWLALFDAAFELGASFKEDHAFCIPGSIFGLGVALGNFDSLMKRIRSAPFFSRDFGRRRRLELALAAERFWVEGEAPCNFLREEASRFAAQFSEWTTDTCAKALYILLERHDRRGIEILNKALADALYSGANWNMALDLIEFCREKRVCGADEGLWAAAVAKLGRCENGERAQVFRACASCAANREEARARLADGLAGAEGSGDLCEIAAVLCGLLELAPDEYLNAAGLTMDRLLGERVKSRIFGAAVSLLRTAREMNLDALDAFGRTLFERLDGHLDGLHLDEGLWRWLQEDVKGG